MTTFHCKACGLLLAEGLSECLEDRLCFDEGSPMLPSKTFFISKGQFSPEQVGDYLVNVDDLLNTRLCEVAGRLNGCCGLDGMDGINHICQNGHEVATVRDDCWMPSHVILSSAMVVVSEASQAAPA